MGALNLGLRRLNAEANGRHFTSDIHFIMPDVGNVSRDFVLKLVDGRRILNPVIVKEFDRPWSAPGVTVPSVLDRWTDTSPLAGTDHMVFFLWGFAEMHNFAFEQEWERFRILGEGGSHEVTQCLLRDSIQPYYLPRAMIREHLSALVEPVLEVVSYLSARGVNVATLAGPPPEQDNQAIKAAFPSFSPASAQTRLEIYGILLELFRTHAASNDYPFFQPPGEVTDPQGFRRTEHRGDGVHGNAEYGRAVLMSLAQIIDP